MKSYEKRDRYYLEVLRAIAILFVTYNHSIAFTFFKTEQGIQFEISLLLSMLCKVAVPIFFMISGTLLLGKNESIKELFQKRVLKCVLALVVFSFLYYMKLVVRGEVGFSIIDFLVSLPQKEVCVPYWYLYAYLSFLLLLPILRPLAQNLERRTFCYFTVLGILFRCILPIVQDLTGYSINSSFNISSVLGNVFFFPIIGYGIDRYVSERQFRNRKGVILNFSMVPVILINRMLAANQYSNIGYHTEAPFGFLVIIPTLLLFIDIKMLIRNEKLSGNMKKIISFIGDKVFGMYLLEGFIGPNGRMDIICHAISPFCGLILAYIIEILCIFIIRLAIVTIMKKLPIFRSIL